jgi:hypothetical protein
VVKRLGPAVMNLVSQFVVVGCRHFGVKLQNGVAPIVRFRHDGLQLVAQEHELGVVPLHPDRHELFFNGEDAVRNQRLQLVFGRLALVGER